MGYLSFVFIGEGSGSLFSLEGSGSLFSLEGSGSLFSLEGSGSLLSLEGSGYLFSLEGSGFVTWKMIITPGRYPNIKVLQYSHYKISYIRVVQDEEEMGPPCEPAPAPPTAATPPWSDSAWNLENSKKEETSWATAWAEPVQPALPPKQGRYTSSLYLSISVFKSLIYIYLSISLSR